MPTLRFPEIDGEHFGDEENDPHGELYVSPERPKPPRLYFAADGLHGAYLDEAEVKRLVKYLQKWMAAVHGSTVANAMHKGN